MSDSGGPLRILHALAPARTGGLESVVVQLSSGMLAQGHDIHVALVVAPAPDAAEHPVAVALRERGVPVHVLALGGREYLAERREIRALLRKLNTQVLHTHGFRPDVLHGGVARGLGIGHVMTLHGFAGSTWRSRVYEWLQVRAGASASAVISVSEPICGLLRDRGIVRNVHLVRNAVAPVVNALNRGEARGALGLPSEGKVVGWVGRVSEEKGPELFVEALARAGSDVHGVMIGDGPLLGRVKELAVELGIGDRFFATGMVAGASRYLAALDVLALTSRTEGTPMILLESMWAGVPIVATAVGGVPDILGPREAELVPVGDGVEVRVAEAIDRAFTSARESEDRARRALERVSREHSPDAWYARHAEIYRESLGGS